MLKEECFQENPRRKLISIGLNVKIYFMPDVETLTYSEVKEALDGKKVYIPEVLKRVKPGHSHGCWDELPKALRDYLLS